MRFLFIFLLLIPLTFAMPASDVRLNDFVNDYANVLTAEQEAQISEYGNSLYTQNLAEYTIVIVDSLDGRDIDSYALEVAQGKIGGEDNKGLVLLIAVEDRQYRFEVGRGLEPIFNDAKVGRIGRTYLVPYFQQGDYATGIALASQAIHDELSTETITTDFTARQSNQDSVYWIVFLIFFILWIITRFRQGKKGRKRSDDDLFGAALLASMFLRGGSGGAGGFSGFSGGGFGGGGAGGSW